MENLEETRPMGQSLTKIETLYDSLAKEYAEEFFGEHAKKPMDQEILTRFAQEMGARSPIWDFGCGPGQTTQYLTDLGLEISGLDLSERALVQARRVHPGIHFQKGNMLDLEFEDGSIAGIVAFYAIVHFTGEQVAAAFREVFRVLEPGGLFLFTFHVGHQTLRLDEFLGVEVDIDFMLFSTSFILSCLRHSGFDINEVIEREPYPRVEYESRRAYVFAAKPSRDRLP
jgi:SAM-dependent methyltransferase